MLRVTRIHPMLLAAVVAVLPLAAANAAPLQTSNSLAVVRVGDGGGPLSAAATATFVDEYTIAYDVNGVPTSASLLQSIPLPTAVVGSARRLTLSGTSTSAGGLSRSGDGRFLVLGGFDSDVGAVDPSTIVGATVNRVIGRIDYATGGIDTTTSTTSFGGTSTGGTGLLRSVATVDGSSYYLGGLANGASGLRLIGHGSSNVAATSLTSSTTTAGILNSRRVAIRNSTLFYSAATSNAGGNYGIGLVGTAGTLPLASSTPALLPGFPNIAGSSSYDFYFADDNTLYVADDRIDGLGGLQKWILSGGTWSKAFEVGQAANVGIRGLSGVNSVGSSVVLFATDTADNVVYFADTLGNLSGAAVSSGTLIASTTDRALRGLVATAIPEPAALGGLVMLTLPMLRRRRS